MDKDIFRFDKIKLSCAFLISLMLLSFGFLKVVDAQVYQFQWGHEGSGEGQFNDPAGIAIDSSNDVYVVGSKSSTHMGNLS